MINTGEVLILQTGVFPHEYKQWREIPEHQRTWEKFQTFWADAWDIKNLHDITAAQVGYGNNAHTYAPSFQDKDNDSIYQYAMNNVTNAHVANSTAFQTLSSTNASLNTNVTTGIQNIQAQINALTEQLQNMEANATQIISRFNMSPQEAPPQYNAQPQYQTPPQPSPSTPIYKIPTNPPQNMQSPQTHRGRMTQYGRGGRGKTG